MELIETSVGLPNSCTVCGKPITTATWFAPHIDAARSGGGGHKGCLEGTAPKTPPTKKQAKSVPKSEV